MKKEPESLRKVLTDIRNHLRDSDPDAIWDFEDIGRYLNISPTYVQSTVSKRKGFPRPIPGFKSRFRADLVKASTNRV